MNYMPLRLMYITNRPFVAQIAFSKIEEIVSLQILNQVSILAVLYFMFAVFIGLEETLKKAPAWLNKTVGFIASITLHIYIVQFVVIRRLQGLIFPLNFAVTTATILALAAVLYFQSILCEREFYVSSIKRKG